MPLFVDIEKSLGSFRLNVCFEVENETLALLGASGCGKSMTLKCIAGIERPDRGRIIADGVTLFDSGKGIDLKPQERRVGLMFQNYALFPGMTVEANIQAGARREKDRAKRQASVRQIMERFDLAELAHRLPGQLSGGQQQRVALARILVSDPRILLLDEPFSALDSHLRFQLEQEVRSVIRSFGKSVLLVSHDRDEVFRMADSIAVLDDGKVEVCGKKAEVFSSPKTRSAAILTGCKNISRLERCENGRGYAADWGIELAVPPGASTVTHLGIRMHDLLPGDGENSFRCKVVEEIENPFSFTIMLRPVSQTGRIPIGWETDKETWSRLRAEELSISLPRKSLLLLEDRNHVK